MIKNYIKTAYRNLVRNKTISLINIIGLAVGLAGVMLIYIFVQHEFSYDTFHQKADRIYRLNFDATVGKPDGRILATTSPPMGPTLESNYPEVERAIRLRYPDNSRITYGDKQFYETSVVFADDGFLQVFTFPLKRGDAGTALDQPNSVVITENIAQKYFDGVDPMGKIIRMDDDLNLKVTGVLKPIPANSHLQFDFVISFTTFVVPFGYTANLESWGWVSFHTYVLLADQTDPMKLEEKLPEMIAQNWSEDRAQLYRLRLQPITDIYFGSANILNNVSAVGLKYYTHGLISVATLILIIAGFNFMNISTARSVRRSKEAGIRKVLGAQRKSLIWQFLTESVVISFISWILAIVFLETAKNYIASFFFWTIDLNWWQYFSLGLTFLIISISVGILAGLYPALVISAFKPIVALRGNIQSGLSGNRLRQVLVAVQFTICIALVVGSLFIARQMNHLRNKDLGFDHRSVISLHMLADNFLERYHLAEKILLQNPHVLSVSAGDIFDGDHGSQPIYTATTPEDDPLYSNIFGAYYNYFSTTGISMVEGREFLRTFFTDSSDAIILNKKAVEFLGFEQPLGQTVRVGDLREGKVIGVTENFHYFSLHSEIDPLIMLVPGVNMEHILLRIAPGDFNEIIRSLQEDWDKIAPDLPFELTFLDEGINKQYRADQRFANLINAFTIFAILVACLGLYGLVAVITQFKVKEIGIRKVLGASVAGITHLLTRQFVLLIVGASIAAWPLAWYAMDEWLTNFAYRIDIDLLTFLWGSLVTLLVAIITISYQTIRAAMANPIDSIRYE